MEEPYKVAFDLSTQPTHGSWIVPLSMLLTGGVVVLANWRSMADRLAMRGLDVGVGRSAVLGVFAVLGVLAVNFVLVVIFSYMFAGWTPSLKAKERTGQVSILEGCLQYLRPGLQKGEKERLQINGRLFEYQDLIFIPAFHTTEYGGGPIYADSKLRLTVAGDYIVKVEVQQHACPAAPDFPRPETS